MKTKFNFVKNLLLLLAFSFTLLGCTNEALDLQEEALNSEGELSARPGTQLHFNTSLNGKNIVPDPISTKAVGQGIVKISKDEAKIHYKITTANIENIFVAHFHMASADANGSPVALLYLNQNQPSGPANGVLAEGYITAETLGGGEEGAEKLYNLIAAIRSGNIYINVHSTAFPSGEIRGQL